MRGRTVIGMKRMTFLIDAAGTIRQIWPTVKPEGHAAEVLEALRHGQDGAPGPTSEDAGALE